MNKTKKEMIEKFQCLGCVCGSDTQCSRFELEQNGEFFYCKNHVLGTSLLNIGSFALGLPKGFCRAGRDTEHIHFNTMTIRLWESSYKNFGWDKFNVPVWAMEKDGYLFVRTYSPRINATMVDVIKGGTLQLVPNAINAGEFYDEMD